MRFTITQDKRSLNYRLRVTVDGFRYSVGTFKTIAEVNEVITSLKNESDVVGSLHKYKPKLRRKLSVKLEKEVVERYNKGEPPSQIASSLSLSESTVSKCIKDIQGLRGRNADKRSCTEEFISKAIAVHGDTYDYSDVTYTRSNIDILIRCKKHGHFNQLPNNHLRGAGCPLCNNSSGFTKKKEGYVYLLESGNLLKVGITNRSPEQRARDVGRGRGKTFSVVASIKTTGDICLCIEKRMLEFLSSHYQRLSDGLSGGTEIFINACKTKAVEMLELITKEEQNGYS